VHYFIVGLRNNQTHVNIAETSAIIQQFNGTKMKTWAATYLVKI